jgi:hypothetical protein
MRVLMLITILVAVLGHGVESAGPRTADASPVLASTLAVDDQVSTQVVWPTCPTAWTCDGDIWYRRQVDCNRDCLTGPCYCVPQ